MIVDFDVSGVERSASRFLTLTSRLDAPAEGLHGVADVLRAAEARRFATRGDGTWRPNRPSTIRRKGNSRVFVLTGATMRSLTTKAPGSVERISGSTLTFGTSKLGPDRRYLAKQRPLFRSDERLARQVASRFMQFLMAGEA